MTALDLTIDAPLTAARTPRHFLDLDALPVRRGDHLRRSGHKQRCSR